MSDSQTPETPTPRALLRSFCLYGDPYCPCQDGDACHYEGDNPMTPPEIGDTE